MVINVNTNTKSSKTSNKRKEIEINSEMNEFLEFFKIDLKSDEDMKQMSDQRLRQYKCRLQRWDSLIETHLMFEVYKALNMFEDIDRQIKHTFKRIEHLRAEPDFEDKQDIKYKSLLKVETETKEVVKQLAIDRKIFDDIYTPFKKMKTKAKSLENDIKEEDITDDEVDVKEEEMSEEDMDYKTFIKTEIKTEIKSEMMSNSDIKPILKSEVKTEIKDELKHEVKDEEDFRLDRVKTELKTSDED